jgi:MFS family permease
VAHKVPGTAEPTMPSFYHEEKMRALRWRIVVALGCTTVLSYGATQYLIGVLEVPLVTTFGWSRAQLSGASSCSLLLAGLLGVPVGWLLDRASARLLLTLGSLLLAGSLVGLALMQTLWQFYLCWGIGIGCAMALLFYPVTFTVVTRLFVIQRAKALAILTLIGALASPIFIPISGWLIASMGWRTMLLLYAGLQLLVAVPLHTVVLSKSSLTDQEHRAGVQEGPSQEVSARQALYTRSFWMLTAALALAMLSNAVVIVHQIAYLITQGETPLLAATFAGGLGLASFPGRFGLSILSTRMTSRTLLAISLLVQAIGLLLLILMPVMPWVLLYILLYGASYGALAPLRGQVMADYFGRIAYGTITGVQGVFIALAQASGPLLAGWLYDVLHTYLTAFWLCTAWVLIAALVVFLLPLPSFE